MEEKEIEFKSLLTKEEYQKIYKYFNLKEEKNIINENYYYDDKKNTLKNNNIALRIRKNGNKKEITLKIKKNKFNLEINNETNIEPIKKIDFKVCPQEISDKLKEIKCLEHLYLISEIVTFRKEKKLQTGLLVLDKTIFLNNKEDYELEFEVNDYEKGQESFKNLLKELSINYKKSAPKIKRSLDFLKN